MSRPTLSSSSRQITTTTCDGISKRAHGSIYQEMRDSLSDEALAPVPSPASTELLEASPSSPSSY
jgi:hypothetical protein